MLRRGQERWHHCWDSYVERGNAHATVRLRESLPLRLISSDDLTAIEGIGIVTQDRLNRSGIKTYAQLAEASPEDLQEILGSRITGARINDCIAEARMLAKEGAPRAA